MVLRRYAAYPIHCPHKRTLAAASKLTTAPIEIPQSTTLTRRNHSKRSSGHPITAYYSFIDLETMKD